MVLQKGTVLLVYIYSQFLLFAQKAIDNYFLSLLIAGVLEANFIEPAHDKQDFERSSVFFRLEVRLKQMIMDYWFVSSKFFLTTFGLNVVACLVLGCNIHQSLLFNIIQLNHAGPIEHDKGKNIALGTM